MEKEAINWFSQLGDTSPLKLLMRPKTNLIAPDAAIAQARPCSSCTAATARALFGLARIAESFNDFQNAADYFLEAVLLIDARAPDIFAINALIAAASNLGRAGLKDDARTQFEWLRRNVKDAEKLELIRREMQKL